jgi:hypothetical protein
MHMFPFTLPLLGKKSATSPSLVIDDDGVHRYRNGELLEEARWASIDKIAIMTTDEGPFAEDFYWLLTQSDGHGCAVPGGLAQEHGLLDALQARYGEAFDNERVIEASGCTDNASFLCWEGSDPKGAAPVS